jgi:hypothetical protein
MYEYKIFSINNINVIKMPLKILENERNKKIFIAIIIIALVITFATLISVAVTNNIPPDDNGGG